MRTFLDARIAAIVNVVTFLGMLVVNILATSLPLNDMTTGDLSDALPNLFVPAGLTFSIWGVIWVLLAAYLVLQLRSAFDRKGAGDAGMIDSDPYAPGVVGFWFPLNMILNAGWIFAWHYQLVGLSVLIMFALLATLIVMFLSIDATIRKTGSQRFAVVPISVYFGWITIATIANITAFLVSVGWGGFGVSDVVWTIVVIAAGLAVNVLMLLRHRSFAFAAVAVWAFAGIAVKRVGEGTPEGPGVLIAALVAGAALVVLAVVLAIRGRSVA
ncbi:MAG: TspO/MBR family protein [Spirochaetota bacterium]